MAISIAMAMGMSSSQSVSSVDSGSPGPWTVYDEQRHQHDYFWRPDLGFTKRRLFGDFLEETICRNDSGSSSAVRQDSLDIEMFPFWLDHPTGRRRVRTKTCFVRKAATSQIGRRRLRKKTRCYSSSLWQSTGWVINELRNAGDGTKCIGRPRCRML